MKSLILAAVFLLGSLSWAEPTTPVVNEDVQKELDAMDDNIVLDQADEQFLNTEAQKPVVKKIESQNKVIWGKAIIPVKKAKAGDSSDQTVQ